MRLRWENIPVPEAHLGGIALGILLQRFIPKQLTEAGWLGQLLGWPLILYGSWLSLSAAIEAGETDISSPDKLLTEGPYRRSRNPMYAGWTLIHAGIASASNAFWLMSLVPLVMLYTHWIDVRREEQRLERTFMDEYLEYKRQVPRYF